MFEINATSKFKKDRKRWNYRRHKYHRISTFNQEYGGVVISDLVKYVIYIGGGFYDKPVFIEEVEPPEGDEPIEIQLLDETGENLLGAQRLTISG